MKKSSKVCALILAAALSTLTLTGCNIATLLGVGGLTDNTYESQSKSDAASLSSACKDLYAEVVAGTMNSSSPNAFPGLPEAYATARVKKEAGLKLTVANAIDYAGIDALSSKLDDFVVDTDTGTIYSKQDDNKPSHADTPVTLDTTMYDLGFR